MNKTYDNIVEAAIEIFNNDFSANLDLVAQKAGTSSRTMQRYFKGRDDLIDVCREKMMVYCQGMMQDAYDASDNPLKQLELTLYAVIDCGSKFRFLQKLDKRKSFSELSLDEKQTGMDNIKSRWFGVISELRKKDLINKGLNDAWVYTLFGCIVDGTIEVFESGDVAPNEVKKIAWYSFSKGIGLTVK